MARRKRRNSSQDQPAGMVNADDPTAIEEQLDDDPAADQDQDQPAAAPKARARKPGPKKVLEQNKKQIADSSAKVLVKMSSGSNPQRALLFEEAQSITTPVMRIIGRRIPAFLKKIAEKYAPRGTFLSPEDAADLQEIGVTIGKYAFRVLILIFQEIIENKEDQQAKRQQERTVNGVTSRQQQQPPVVPGTLVMPQQPSGIPADRIGVAGGHNPVFDMLPAYDGQGDVA